MATPEENLTKLGLELPDPAPEESNNTRCVRVGNLLYLSAHAPRKGKGTESVYPGVVGRDVTLAQAQEAATYAALSLIATLKRVLGDLGKVKKFVSTTGAVAATPEFSMRCWRSCDARLLRRPALRTDDRGWGRGSRPVVNVA